MTTAIVLGAAWFLLPVVFQSWFTGEMEDSMVMSIESGELKQEILAAYGDTPRLSSAINQHYNVCTDEPISLVKDIGGVDDIGIFLVSFDIQSSIVQCVGSKSGNSFQVVLRDLKSQKKDFVKEWNEM